MSDEEVQHALRVLERHGIDPVSRVLHMPPELQEVLKRVWWWNTQRKRSEVRTMSDAQILEALKTKSNDVMYLECTYEAYYRNLPHIGVWRNTMIVNRHELIADYIRQVV